MKMNLKIKINKYQVKDLKVKFINISINKKIM